MSIKSCKFCESCQKSAKNLKSQAWKRFQNVLDTFWKRLIYIMSNNLQVFRKKPQIYPGFSLVNLGGLRASAVFGD